MTAALAEEKGHCLNQIRALDLSWVKELNSQAEKLSKTHQEDARTIVEEATKTASQHNHCEQNHCGHNYCGVARELRHQAEKIGRKSLQLNEDKQSARYPQLLIFVSFSMPLEVLKALASQAGQAGGKLVLRGLVNGNFKDTAEKIKELQKDIIDEVIIDPTLFEAYQVEIVPTFVLRRERTDKIEKTSYHDRLSGNISLEYALEQFTSSGNTSQEATHLLKILRKKP